METITQFRQMMAESKFIEVQKLIEVQLAIKNESRSELLQIYFDSLKAQQKSVPIEIILELSERESENNRHDVVLELLKEVSPEHEQRFFLRIIKLRMSVAVQQGQMDQLYQLLSSFFLRQYESQNPSIPEFVSDYVRRFFIEDFTLRLKELAITLVLNDIVSAEKLTLELILSTFEKSSVKGIKNKLLLVADVLRSGHNKAHLEIYQNFCLLSANGLNERSDYKKIVEMIIFFDDFKFQTLILNLLHNLNLVTEAEDYASSIRGNKEYNFVHFDKYFPHLKSYFVALPKKTTQFKEVQVPTPDLKLSLKVSTDLLAEPYMTEETEGENTFLSLLKYQAYTVDQLCDLAVSFLQSEMPKVALRASELAVAQATDNSSFLKGSYLKLTCQLQLQDLRAALDTCLEALSKATTRDDILSFQYGQAEIYIRLNQKKQAKGILAKILAIDSKYRLAKERLDKLNEI